MTFRRTMDAAFLNSVVNHPEVRPGLGGEGELDLSDLLGNPLNVALVNDHGGFIGIKLDDGLYEIHSQFLPPGRGPCLAGALAEAQRYIFTLTDCTELVTKVPQNNRAALGLARLGGMRALFERADAWPLGDGETCGIAYFGLTFDQWRARDPEIATWGRRFHDQLEAAKAAAGATTPDHPDDEAHDRAAGAAVLMLIAGNVRKAVRSYNRWAVFAGYVPIRLISETPPILDIADAIVTLRGGALEVLKCQ